MRSSPIDIYSRYCLINAAVWIAVWYVTGTYLEKPKVSNLGAIHAVAGLTAVSSSMYWCGRIRERLIWEHEIDQALKDS